MPVTQRPQSYVRRPTRVVWIGGVAVGGNYPIRVQSMITSDTKNTQAVVDEMVELVDAGCEIIRVTVPTQADCDNLPSIRTEMKKRGLKVPLVADIHFTPSIAMQCVEYVDKVRVNPGNFVDKKKFEILNYSDVEYQSELQKVYEKFAPLVTKCLNLGVAMRIGTNHGSLSDRILNRFGDTPEGMVESALEFARICRELNYHDIVFSMKASNVQVMTAAYRLLVLKLDELKWNYPLHLGVTEAGEGEDGRVKSAIGIGSLLEDGLGDTIRVSLTEDAVYEIPVAYKLVEKYNAQHIQSFGGKPASFVTSNHIKYSRRSSQKITVGGLALGGDEVPRVFQSIGFNQIQAWEKDYALYLKDRAGLDFPLEGLELQVDEDFSFIQNFLEKIKNFHKTGGFRAKPVVSVLTTKPFSGMENFEKVAVKVSNTSQIDFWKNIFSENKKTWEWCLASNNLDELEEMAKHVTSLKREDTLISVEAVEPVYAYRRVMQALGGAKNPIHLRVKGTDIQLPVLAGSLFMDGVGDGLTLSSSLNLSEAIKLSYSILQGARLRISKAEYISCPSCGRTLFNLQSTTEQIRKATSHLKGVKIGVMGCIVNGPGEMADADFGYVGTGPKKISLYVGQECVKRNLPEGEAVESLIALIKEHGRWVDPV